MTPMRSIALLLLLLGVLVYLLPNYRSILPISVPLTGSDVFYVAVVSVGLGLVLFILSMGGKA
jgi:hypothetical protein